MSPPESFTSAIRAFDVDTVEKLLKSDLDIEYRSISFQDSVLNTAVALINSETMGITRFVEESDKHLSPLHRPEALRRIIEVLLDSGRFNVNALTDLSYTVLHLAVEYHNVLTSCTEFSCEGYKDMVNAIIELLLKNNANINAKTCYGETPLMMSSQCGCSHIVKLLLDWRDEFGVGVDLNARDIFGETALIKAAKWDHVDVIELLLQHGCLDEFQDHRGFYALHAVIYGDGLIDDVSGDFLGSIGIDLSEKTLALLHQYGANNFLGRTIYENWNRNNDIQKIVKMLVTVGRADVNSLDFRGNTVLDLAFKSKLRINQETVEKLLEYGATSGALLNKHPEYPKNTLEYTDKLGKTPLHRLSAVLPNIFEGGKDEVFDSAYILNSSPYKELFEAMAATKDHIARTALHYAVLPTFLFSRDGFLLMNVLKLKRTINKRDKYGRIPLHYCQNEYVYELLVKHGANEHIQDIDGKTPRDLKKLRYAEHSRHNLPLEAIRVMELLDDDENKKRTDDISKLGDQLNQRKLDAWMIWKDSKYAYVDQFSAKICDKVRHFMNRLSDEIGKKDPRFECRPVLIGSAEEGTKTGLPDEFDINFILTKLSEVCEVVPSPEAPSGFVHLKRGSCSAEYQPKSQDFQSQDDFDGLFNSNGFLLTTEIASRFRILYLQIMSEPEFWKDENVFEWDTCNEIGMVYLKQEGQYNDSEIPNDFRPSTHPCSTLQLKLNRPIEGRYMFTPISVDIVPCIKINGWWPEEALSGVNDEIKAGGCHLVFDQPQRKYPWVPFSDPFARISFAPAEGQLIKECSAVARAAYMVGKQLLYYYKSKFIYVLKTCLLYCIEALKDYTGNSLLYEDINPAELRFFVEKLMLCFHEFYLKDFLPCYMMPSFHLPIENYFKSNHELILYAFNYSRLKFPFFAYSLYSIVCTTESPVEFCPPTLEPLNEKFNREELLRKLSMDRSSIENRHVQQEFLATGQLVQSDSQSGSQVRLSTSRKRKRRVQMKANKAKVKKEDLTTTK